MVYIAYLAPMLTINDKIPIRNIVVTVRYSKSKYRMRRDIALTFSL